MPVVRVRPAPIPGDALHRRPFAPGRSPGLPRPAACRGRLKIGYQITTDRLQGLVEIAYRTDRRQVLTTILWVGRIEDVSRRLMTDALLVAADEGCPVGIHVFAVAAHNRLDRDFVPEAAPLRDELRGGDLSGGGPTVSCSSPAIRAQMRLPASPPVT